MEHKQVKVEHPEWGEIEVDEGLSELLSLMWALDIETILSCQENQPGIAWICFPTALYLEQFLDLVAQYPEGHPEPWTTLYARIRGEAEEGNWDYSASAEDMNVLEHLDEEKDEVTEECIGPSHFVMSISARFPVSDIEELVKRLKRYDEETV